MFNDSYGSYYNGQSGNNSTAINFLNGIGIGTHVYVWFDSSGFIRAKFEGIQNGVALFTVDGFTLRIPVRNIVAVAT